MNWKSAAAIAVLVIVVAPIGLGYLMATEDVTRTGWESDKSVNLSDHILNDSTPYYTPMTGPENNMFLENVDFVPVAMDYVSVGSTASSLPVYGVTDDLIPGLDPELISKTATSIYYGVEIPMGHDAYYITANVPVSLFYSIEYAGQQIWAHTEPKQVFGPILFDESRGRYVWEDVSFLPQQGGAYFSGIDNNVGKLIDFNILMYDVETMHSTDGGQAINTDCSVKQPQVGLFVKIFNTVGTQLIRIAPNVVFSITGNMAYVGDELVSTTAERIEVCTAALDDQHFAVLVSHRTKTGHFADPADGWKLPSNGTMFWWSNGLANRSVTMYVSGITDLSIRGLSTDETIHNMAHIEKNNDGMITVSPGDATNGVRLGVYEFFQIYIDGSSIRVSGIDSWPDMYQTPELTNSITFPVDNGQLRKVQLATTHNADMTFRVDSVEMQAGTFAITKDYTLNMADLWPGESSTLDVLSVGIFGDYLTWGGCRFDVDDTGQIMIDHKLVPLKGCKFSSVVDDDGMFLNSVNGVGISSTVNPASMFFGGDWSLSLRGYQMQKITGTTHEWAPGGFAFDSHDFLVVGMICSVLAFVGIGAARPMNGSKIGLLAVICAGAGVVLMILL